MRERERGSKLNKRQKMEKREEKPEKGQNRQMCKEKRKKSYD